MFFTKCNKMYYKMWPQKYQIARKCYIIHHLRYRKGINNQRECIPYQPQHKPDVTFIVIALLQAHRLTPFLLQKYWFVYISMILSFSLPFAYFLCFWLFVCFPHFSMHVIYEPLFHLFYASLIAIIRFTVFPKPQ